MKSGTAMDLVPDHLRAGYFEKAADLYELAYAAQGQRAFESTKRAASLHEAGHVVVYQATAGGQWWPAHQARVWRLPISGLKVWTGATEVSSKAPSLHVDVRVNPQDAVVHAMRLLSGVVSEMVFDGADFRFGSSADELIVTGGIARALESIGAYPSAEQAFFDLFQRTAELLQRNMLAVKAIATQLEATRKIDAKGIASRVA